MIIVEVCKDLSRTKKILQGLIKYDKVKYMSAKDGKAIGAHQEKGCRIKGKSITSTLPDAQKAQVEGRSDLHLESRQKYRELFKKLVVQGLYKRYSQQANLYYRDTKEIGVNLLNGANKQMDLSPTFYGQKARKLIIDAVILML